MNEQSKTKAQHTPGPWKVSDKMMTDEMICRHDALGAWVHSCRYIEGAGKLLADAQSNEPIGTGCNGGHPQVESRDEMLANARLIAAAPDLLAALKEVYELCGEVLKRQPNAGEYAHNMAVGLRWKVSTAIKRAEGGAE